MSNTIKAFINIVNNYQVNITNVTSEIIEQTIWVKD